MADTGKISIQRVLLITGIFVGAYIITTALYKQFAPKLKKGVSPADKKQVTTDGGDIVVGDAHLLRDETPSERRLKNKLNRISMSREKANEIAAKIKVGSVHLEDNLDYQNILKKAGYKAIKDPNCLSTDCSYIAVRADAEGHIAEVVKLTPLGAAKMAKRLASGKLNEAQTRKAIIALEANDYAVKNGRLIKVIPHNLKRR